jgi:hypothetical protein
MTKQNDKQPTSSDIPEHIVSLMGPTAADAAPTDQAPVEDTPTDPASAPPLIPNDKLPEEMRQTEPSTETPDDAQQDTQAPTTAQSAETPDGIDEETDAAVDDITRSESDSLLQKEDDDIAKAFVPPEKPKGFRAKLKNLLSRWWHNPKARNATFAVIGLLIVAVFAVPSSRYFVLNIAGVRAAMSVVVLDESTRQPLKNVLVQVGTVSAQTDTEGKVTLKDVKLGASELKVEKVAFAPFSKKVTIGWGSNPLGDVPLTPTGAQYRFVVKDFLTDKPLSKTEATSGLASAIADENGEIVLTVDVQDQDKIDVSIAAADYRVEKRTIATSLKDTQTVKMAPAQQHVFVSKRSGKYDLFKVYADGKQEKLLLAASGSERDDMVIAPHSTKPTVAVVSTRDNKRNDDGFLLSSLSLVDVNSGELKSVATSERIQIIDWVDDRLVYVTIAAGQSANSPKRHRLMTYDTSKDELQELAYSNYFNDVMVAQGVIYYAPSSANQKNKVALHRVKADGTDAQQIIDKEAWNLFRIDYQTIQFSVGQAWYEYKLGDVAPTTLAGAPADPKNRLYRDSPDKSKSLWADQRDGKGVLLSYDLTARQDKIIQTQSGLRNPIGWLSKNHIIYRLNTNQETADYVLNLDGGEPRKIQDVTNTGGIDRWYYYQ